MTYWFQRVRTASWRGVPFKVHGGELRVGRRTALHQYPNRDEVWVEDMGREAQRVTLTGYIFGDDVVSQRQRLWVACEKGGGGELVHPTLGRMKVTLADPAVFIERWDSGRYFEIVFSFIETGNRAVLLPSNQASTGGSVLSAALAADAAAAIDFATAIGSALLNGATVIAQGASTVSSWTHLVNGLATQATNLYRMVSTLPGEFGRFLAGSNNGLAGLNSVATAVQGLIAQGAVQRAAVTAAGVAMEDSATALTAATVADFAAAAQALVEALLAAMADPADAVEFLQQLAGFAPTGVTSSSPIGLSMAAMQSGCGDLFRRAALVALARAAQTYQPSSYDDAANIRGIVTSALDAEALLAADQGNDNTFLSLRALRAAVAVDLQTRGASLAHMTTFTVGQPLPSLVLAQRFYQDSSRADELVMEAKPRHPAFMPTVIQALSS